MPDDPRVQQLLDRLLDSDATPEEVCASCAELLPVVRHRWQQMCRARSELDAMFPPAAGPEPEPPPEHAPLPVVPGYEVQAVLGVGGMGVVFRARHLQLNRVVALKMTLAGAYAGPHERDRFQCEAEAVARLQHPNVVQIHDIGDADGRPYFTMEFVEGGSLAQKLSGAPQPAREAAALIATLAGAVQVAHTAGIVHRDLKPGNVLLTSDGTPKVTDFGLARRLDGEGGLTGTGTAVGTPSYMAPEQARGQRAAVGPPADVYALGAILYETLTGRPPFRGRTPAETVHQVLGQDPVPPTRLNARVPRDLETICLHCLHKEPEKRYPRAADLAADLARFLNHEPIRARPIGPVARGLRWVRRHPAPAGLLAAVGLLVLIGGVGAGLLYRQSAAAGDHQAQTDREVRRVLEQARGPLDEAWRGQDLAKLAEAVAEGTRAVDIARSGAANAAARREAEEFRADAEERLGRAAKNRALREALLDVSARPDTGEHAGGEPARRALPAQPSPDEQYAAAFRRWGLDVDRSADAELVGRLGAEPDVVVQELIAALDAWMLERRRRKRPEPEWGRLFRVAEQLDRDDRHHRLRALLVGEAPPRAETVAGLLGAVPPWPALWELAGGDDWRRLRQVRMDIDPRSEPVLTLLLLAQAFADVGDAAGAEEVLSRAATARPDDVALLDGLGKLLARQGPSRGAKAIEYYRAARARRPRLGIALSGALTRAGRAAEAEDVLRDLLRQGLETPAVFNQLGTCLYAQKRVEAAAAAYRRAIDLAPDFAAAHGNLAVCLSDQQRHGEAEAACRGAIGLRPEDADLHYYLGNILARQNKHPAAAAAYRRAIDLRHNDAEAHYNLGNSLTALQEHEAAAAAYRDAIAHQPDFALAHNNLGMALIRQQDLGAAEAAFRKASALRPDYAVAHRNLGMALSQQRRYGEAEAAYRRAIDRQPDFAVAHLDLGNALLQQARFDEALAFVRKGIDLLPARDPLRQPAQRLLEDCQRSVLLDARLPAILERTQPAASAAEQVEFGRLCFAKGLYAAAARLFADALTADPRIADDVPAGTRYNAARAAALAGCAMGKDTDNLDDAGRSRWRRRALEWLRQDLRSWGKVLADDSARSNVRVRQWMRIWQVESDFACVRTTEGLTRLPDGERSEWEKLWADVEALRRQADARPNEPRP